ncbi:MAG: hypothetical protein EA380_06090 [Phycisphaeraceae bacterium]|nr:MAG: hypothetical protein EA380_06090 [Phycisphaeraceae bacterium]
MHETGDERGIDQRPIGREPVVWGDLTRSWVWPMLLRTPAMALAPGRLLLGIAGGAAWWIVSALWHDSSGFADGFVGGMPSSLFPRSPVSAVTLSAVLFWVIVLVPLSAVGIGIARSAILRVSSEAYLGLSASVLFAARAWKAWLGAVAIQGVVMLVVVGAAALLWKIGIAVFADAGYLVSIIAGILWLALFACQTMIVPAIAAERTDAMDALQRAGAYLVARTLRWLLYFAIVLGMALLAAGVVLLAWWAGVSGLNWDRETNPTLQLAGMAMRLLVTGVAVSYWYTASGVIYLLMRRIVDRQDIREIWVEPTPSAPRS